MERNQSVNVSESAKQFFESEALDLPMDGI